MKLFRKQTLVEPKVLLSSELHDERSFYQRLIQDIALAEHSIYIESPFISTKRVNMLLPFLDKAFLRGVRVKILTRDPASHDGVSAIEAFSATQFFKKLGFEVHYSSPYHHRKLVIIDDSILYEGSLNVLSHVRSQEMMRRLCSKEIVNQTKKYLMI